MPDPTRSLSYLIFTDDDSGYLQWVKEHPTGFVLNTTRPAFPTFLILHIASCPAIMGKPGIGNYWTADCIKVCASERADLEVWGRNEVGGEVKPCRLCKP